MLHLKNMLIFLKNHIKNEIVIKHAEMKALMRAEKPDAEKVGELAGELFDLRTSMRTKAEAAGLGDYIGMRGGCHEFGGPGLHHGRKGMMKGQGMMNNQIPAEN